MCGVQYAEVSKRCLCFPLRFHTLVRLTAFLIPAAVLPFACITKQALISTLLYLLHFSYLPLDCLLHEAPSDPLAGINFPFL